MELSFLKDISDFIYNRTFQYKYRIRWALAFAVALIVIILYHFDTFERLELLTLDYRFKFKQSRTTGSDIVFIDMVIIL